MVTCRDAGEGWSSEEHAVLPGVVKHIVEWCGLTGVEMIDSFSDEKNKRFPKRMQDAWVCSWAPPLWVWCNPPFSKFNEVVMKWLAEGARGIIVSPDWQAPWQQDVTKISRKQKWYPAGVEFFELKGKIVGPTRWPVNVFFIDGFQLQPCAAYDFDFWKRNGFSKEETA